LIVLVPWMDCVTVEAHFQLIALVAFLFIIIPHFVSHFMFSIASSFDPVLIDEKVLDQTIDASIPAGSPNPFNELM
jgi:hypothetical protein